MQAGYRIVCVTPAGRRRYLRVLSSYVLASPLVDEYQLWKNTTNSEDLTFLAELQASDARIKIIDPTELPPGSNASIRQFYRSCTDERTIYIRLDDDIVFIEPEFFAKLVKHRIDHPEYFVIFPNIINNAICTYIQAMRGVIDPGAWIHPWSMDITTWGNSHFAEQIHRAFLQSITTGEISRWYFGPQVIALSRFSVNCMCWLGSEFAKFDGIVYGDEEEYLSVIKPYELSLSNCIFGDTIAAHFAFHPQREYLDSTDLLSRYHGLANSHPNPPQRRLNPALQTGKLWTGRLLETIDRFLHCSRAELASEEFIASQLRYAGLIRDRRLLYGDDNKYMNTESAGLWQIPMQMARFLRCIAQFRIERVVDVGTAAGWTIAIMTAFLVRHNPNIQVVTLDTRDLFRAYPDIKNSLPLQYYPGKTAKDFAFEPFDLAFIDADHSYSGCLGDYEAVGQRAALCALHDINDKFVASHPDNDGGVPRLWNSLKSAVGSPGELYEFLDHSHRENVMGIGLLVHQNAQRHPIPNEPS